MRIDVTFEQNDMMLQPQFGEVIQVGANGAGVIYYPSVSDDGIISWSNNGDLKNPEPVNIKGEDGYTPVKGRDYWTDADKTQMVTDVIAALPVYNGEVVQ